VATSELGLRFDCLKPALYEIFTSSHSALPGMILSLYILIADSEKDKVLKRLLEIGVAFALLVPVTTLSRQYFAKIMQDVPFKILVPSRRVQFTKGGVCAGACSFDTVFLLCLGFQQFFPGSQIQFIKML